jgi:EAL domain-containing protein (putative c-di-GMP-specific phosphodiesterase class I)
MAQRAARLVLLGTALKPLHYDVLGELLERADTSRLRQATATGLPTPAEVEAALADGRFLPYYEPRIEIASGMLRSLDVQPCWMHPERGLIRAARFLPASSGTDWIAPLTTDIAAQALRQLRAWHDIGLISLGLSIKLPAETLADRAQIDQLSALVRELGLQARTITWECQEPVLAGGAPLTIANLAHLGVRGFGLALGGYRAGHTTQQHLARCPLTELRIDPVIVHEASQHPPRKALLQQSLATAHQMGMVAVAEGVELVEDLALLRSLGCELAQGTLVAAPMPGNALAAWIKNNRRRLKELAQTP